LTTSGPPTTTEQLELLLHTARERLHSGQQALELEVPAPVAGSVVQPVVEATGSPVLWDALAGLYDALRFAMIRDEAFRALVLGRIIEPISKGRHGPSADRGRRRVPVTGHLSALSAANRGAGLPRQHLPVAMP
jgi:hypothetical protein